MTSIMPTLLAIIMSLSPTPGVTIVVWHLFTFASAAVLSLLFFSTVKSRWGEGTAAWSTAAMLTTPVLCTQIDMLGMEMQLCAAAMLAGYFVSRRRFPAAAASSFFAFLVKPTGLILTVANILLLLTLIAVTRGGKRIWWISLILNGVFFALAIGILGLGGSLHAQVRDRMPMLAVLAWCPDLVLLTLGTVILCLAVGFKSKRVFPQGVRKVDDRRWTRLDGASVLTRRRALELFSLLVVAGTPLAASKVAFVPRYLCIAIPFLYLLFVAALSAFRLRPVLVMGVFAGIGIINLGNWNGALFPDPFRTFETYWGYPADRLAREGSFLERSHEYLGDHREMIEAIHALEEYLAKNPDAEFICGLPEARIIPNPSFGYTRTPLFGYSIWRIRGYVPRFQRIQDLPFETTPYPVFFRTANVFHGDWARFEIPLPDPGDEIIYRKTKDAPLVVYRKRWPDGIPSPQELRRWFLRRLWPNYVFFYYLEELLNTGETAEAIVQTRLFLETRPNDPRATLLLANLLDPEADVVEIEKLFSQSMVNSATLCQDLFESSNGFKHAFSSESPPARQRQDYKRNVPSLSSVLGQYTLDQRGLSRALAERLMGTIPSIDASMKSLFHGFDLLAQGRPKDAMEWLDHRSIPTKLRVVSHAIRGDAFAIQGQWVEAKEEYRKARDGASRYVPALVGLGISAARLKEYDQARESLERALQLDPENTQAKIALAALNRLLKQT
ncbi:MAG: tetratricopeptide repeat protein [Planctomycetota bacterium]